MTNPTEITNILELTNITEITLTNVVTNVLDKIDIVSVDKIKDIPTDWVSVLGAVATVLGTAGTIAIPVVLWSLNNKKEKRESIQKFIDTRLELPKFSKIIEYEPKERKGFFYDTGVELYRLKLIIESTKYKYLLTYIDKIRSIIENYNDTDDFPVYYNYIIVRIHEITIYMNIGEETFNKIWEEDFETAKKNLEKALEDNKKQKQN